MTSTRHYPPHHALVAAAEASTAAICSVSYHNASSRILGYRQSLSKIDKPFLTMLDKLCLHFFCSCLQFSVLTRFVCRICLHFDPGFGGFFADKVCLQDLSAFWPGFGGFSADKVCLQSLSVRTSCADKVCLHVHEFVCNIHQMTNLVYSRQTLSTV